MSRKSINSKSKTLKRVGLWATVWWGVSGLYVVMLIWAARTDYAAISQQAEAKGFLPDWQSAISGTYQDSTALPILLAVIILVWIVGGWVWLREIKRLRISYAAAFKDLFLTIR